MSSGVGRAAGVSLLCGALAVAGCVYPRRSTSLSPVRGRATTSIGAPSGVVSLTIVEATIAPRRGSMDWDDGGGLPDCFVRVYRNEAMVFETPTIADSMHPEFEATLPESLLVPANARIRLEVWDRDTLGSDPVGAWRGVGLPANAMSGGEARVLLEGGSYLTIRTGPPAAYRGIGIRSFEVRPGELVVVEVEPYSPAGRAGIEPGDRIVAIGDQTVGALGASGAAGALSLAADRHQSLRILNGRGASRVVELDRGYTYLVH